MNSEDLVFISGCHNGADIGFLNSAQYLGLRTEGFMTNGCQTEYGSKVEYLEKYHLKETFGGLKESDMLNLNQSDLVIAFLPPLIDKNVRPKPFGFVQLLMIFFSVF